LDNNVAPYVESVTDGTSLVFAMDPSGWNRSQQYQGGLQFLLDGFIAKEITVPSK